MRIIAPFALLISTLTMAIAVGLASQTCLPGEGVTTYRGKPVCVVRVKPAPANHIKGQQARSMADAVLTELE